MAGNKVDQTQLALVLTFATGMPPLLTAGVSVLGSPIRADLGITRAEFGLFALVLFLVTAALSIPIGRISDRLPFTVGISSVYVFATLGLFFAAISQELWSLLLASVCGAFGLALVGPVTNRMVGVLGMPSRRGTIIATKHTGVQIGQVLASVICSLAVSLLNWRAGLGAMAILALFLLAPTLVWLIRSGSKNVPRVWTNAVPIVVPILNRPILMIIILSVYAFLSGIVYQAVLFGLPVFAHESFALSVSVAGSTLVVVGIFGFLSRLSLGSLMDKTQKVRGALIVVAAIALLGIFLLLLAAFSQQAWLMWAGAVIYGLASTASTVLCSIAVIRYFPLTQVGFTTGIVMLSTFVGFALGPMLFGLLVDSQGQQAAWAVFALITAMSVVVPVALNRVKAI